MSGRLLMKMEIVMVSEKNAPDEIKRKYERLIEIKKEKIEKGIKII